MAAKFEPSPPAGPWSETHQADRPVQVPQVTDLGIQKPGHLQVSGLWLVEKRTHRGEQER